jgi:hypothetical protein
LLSPKPDGRSNILLISYLGSTKGSIIIGAIVSVSFCLKQGRKTYFVALWLVLLGVGLSVRYGKLIFHRVRPVDVGFYEETTFLFPVDIPPPHGIIWHDQLFSYPQQYLKGSGYSF